MSVTVDRKPLAADELGLRTVGQVLAHLQRDNRLVVNVLIDGHAPDIDRMSTVRQSPVLGHTLFIETADPRQMAAEVLDEVAQQLDEADRLKKESSSLLQQGMHVKALEKLSGCLSIWQHAQESIDKTAQLLRIDLKRICVEPQTLSEFLTDFAGTLRQIKTALENRDFVLLSDILAYETTEASTRWRTALAAMRAVIQH